MPRSDTGTGTVRLVVKASKRAGVAGLRQAGRRMGFEFGRTIPRIGWSVVEVPAAEATALKARLLDEGVAAEVERDVRTHVAAVPNDPLFGGMWQLNNTGQAGGTPDADIDAPEAWGIETGSPGVIVAVCDTGVQLSHPDLAGNAWVNADEIAGNGVDDDHNGKVDDVNGWDWVHDDATVYDPADDDEHGTHVAGTIGAVGNNGIGVTGINQDVSIMALKTIGSAGGELFDAAAAIVYAVDNGATVINHSWVAGESISALDDAIAYAGAHGVINVAAAGNEGSSNDEVPYFPASSEASNVISVAASDRDDVFPWWSNTGSNVDLAAPGVDTTSTLPGGYASWSGTSMAAPHVTGAIALLRAAFPSATAEELRARIEETVDRPTAIHGPFGRVVTNGRLNLASALAPEFAAGPTITSPAAGAVLEADSTAHATWEAPPFASSSASYQLQAGVESDVLSDGFEAGLTGWTVGGAMPFFRTSSAAYVHSGSWGVRSGAISNEQTSSIGGSIVVPAGGGRLDFWYWLDSEEGWDVAYMLVDGVDWWGMNRNVGWTHASVPLSGGTHSVVWSYAKDESYSDGSDAMALDDVRVTAWDWSPTVSTPAGASSADFTVPGVETGRAGIRIRGVLGSQVSNWSEVKPLTIVGTGRPSAPTGLQPTAGDGEIRLDWNDAPEPDVGSWEVWRAAPSQEGTLVATVSSSAFQEDGLVNGVRYEYGVVAVDGEGLRSNTASTSVTPQDATSPAAPTGLTAVAGPGRVTLAWNDGPEPDLKDWEVWRASDLGSYSRIAIAASPSYADTAVDNGVTYVYKLRARDTGDNASAYSAAVSARPRAVVTRLAGTDRYATAIAVSRSTFAAAETVVIATGEAFPDALSASALAGAYRGPLLLTRTDSLPSGLAAELERLGAKKVVLVGGTGAVSKGVAAALTSGGLAVTRVSGADRYSTSAAVASRVKALGGAERVFVARGDAFPDALSASPPAYAMRYPVLLVKPDSVPAATVSALVSVRPSEAIVLGSRTAVSDSVRDGMGVVTERWGGSDRYATAALVAGNSAERGWVSFDALGVATGASFADALGSGAALGFQGGVLLLSYQASLPRPASTAIGANARRIDYAYVVGGVNAVSAGVEISLRTLLGL